MKIALYIPYTPDLNTVPSLGPLYLASILEKNSFEVKVFDSRIEENTFQKLIHFRPDILGVSAVTPAYPVGIYIAQKIKKLFPSVKVIFGGPHPSILPHEALEEDCIDYVLIGEAEKTFLDLCFRLQDDKSAFKELQEVKSLGFKYNGNLVLTEKAQMLSDEELDNLPYPAFHLMDIDAYFQSTQLHGLYRRGSRILPIMSTRGCPYACTFCCRVMGDRIRKRSPDSVISEIRFLVNKYKIDEIYFEDDNFTFYRERAMEILDRLAYFRPSIYIKFANGIRADCLDKEIFQMMKKANVYSISLGIESGCEATLKRMRKNINLDKARENVLLAKEMGFLVGANCIIGYPEETPDEIEQSLNYFLSLPLDSMAIVNLVPFPGTEVHKLCVQKGYLTQEAKDWSNYFFSIYNPIPLVETPHLTRRELIKQIRSAYRRMYIRPKWIWRSVRQLSFKHMLIGIGLLLGLNKVRKNRGKIRF